MRKESSEIGSTVARESKPRLTTSVKRSTIQILQIHSNKEKSGPKLISLLTFSKKTETIQNLYTSSLLPGR